MLSVVDYISKHLLVLLEFIALIFCIKYFKRLKIFRPYLLVYLVGFSQCFIAVYFNVEVNIWGKSIDLSFALISLFLFTEVLANAIIYSSLFKNWNDTLIALIILVLQSINIYSSFTDALNHKFDHTSLYVSQSLILIFFSSRIIQLEFKKESENSESKSPILFYSFATFFFCLVTLPMYVFHDYALHNFTSLFGYLYTINDVAYIVYTFLILTSLKWIRNSIPSA